MDSSTNLNTEVKDKSLAECFIFILEPQNFGLIDLKTIIYLNMSKITFNLQGIRIHESANLAK